MNSHDEGGRGLSCLTGKRGPGSLALAERSINFAALASVLEERIANGQCERPESNELVVHLRMGDKRLNVSQIQEAIESQLVKSSSINHIVFNGVIQFTGHGAWVVTQTAI